MNVMVDQQTDHVAETKATVAEVPTEGEGTVPIAEQIQTMGLTDPPPSYGHNTDGQGAPPYKKLKKMRHRVRKVRNTPSNKDTLAVKLSKIFWRSGILPYKRTFGMVEMHDQVREARNTSEDKCTFAAKLCKIFWRSAACPVCMLSLAILPIVMIVIGAVYYNDCPSIYNHQTWLIVFGSFGLFDVVINIVWRCLFCNCNRDSDDDDECCNRERDNECGTLICGILDGLINTFLLCWILVGSIWVFKHYVTWRSDEMCYDPNNPEPSCYCHPVPYLFSFITLNVIYSISGLFFLCGCLYCCVACFAGG